MHKRSNKQFPVSHFSNLIHQEPLTKAAVCHIQTNSHRVLFHWALSPSKMPEAKEEEPQAWKQCR